ncbi:isocitrate/isopropylmalate dehydrogenase family protein [Gordonia sp. TBRC 11910]|uniref:Isocitrate/isopropylmalate dehydrogenase family protein n=1 Tax=Gordonia asplenii TaxID=2725283 RepID=A0A848LBN5_9ACTN|nr:isocitrate/isopropylmalate family dehydrogenase [Gordonia asplenii]NMO04998.1 isocitrate/isopropylmalate dehydrogenase family protein [Gordonia asplenii]
MGDSLRIGVLHGDGIGPEIVPAATTVVSTALGRNEIDVEWVDLPFGAAAIESHGTPAPDETLRALDGLDAWILGPHDSAGYPAEFAGQLTPGAVIRKRYNLFANLRPSRALAADRAMSPGIDLLIVRENSEGLYADRNMATGSGEFMPTPDVALAVGVVTRAASERIAREAFTWARRRRGKLTIVHKANVLTMTTGLFRDACLDVGRDFPDVEVSQQHVDAMAAHLVRRAADFDVVVTENLFGDILSDLAAELAGSLGTAASINCSSEKAMAQAAHGAAPDIAGRGIANPTAMIGSAAMLLAWLAQRSGDERIFAAAGAIDAALAATVAAGVSTADLGGAASTAEFAQAVAERV